MFAVCSFALSSFPELDLIFVFDFSAVYAFDITLELFPDEEEDELLIPLPLAFTNVDLVPGELDDLLAEVGLDSGEEVVF